MSQPGCQNTINVGKAPPACPGPRLLPVPPANGGRALGIGSSQGPGQRAATPAGLAGGRGGVGGEGRGGRGRQPGRGRLSLLAAPTTHPPPPNPHPHHLPHPTPHHPAFSTSSQSLPAHPPPPAHCTSLTIMHTQSSPASNTLPSTCARGHVSHDAVLL